MVRVYSFFKDPQIVLTALCALFLILSFPNIHPVMPYLSVVFGSVYALDAAFNALKSRVLDVNFLMVLAAAGALIVGRPIDAAILLFLFSLSNTLESLAMAKTRSAIEGLIKLRPDKAIKILGDQEVEVPTEELVVGDLIRVPSYQQVPADGVVNSGVSTIDESAMTGESRPAEKILGDRVFAGTQNLEGMLVIRVTAPVSESTLEKIVALVSEAQANKATGEKISSWFGQRYTFFVIGCFLVSLLVRSMISPTFNEALYRSLTLLVALSPCALVIATPAATLSALAYAARRGILVRGGQYIEAAGKVNAIALDKTGTLTLGRLGISEICLGTGWDRSGLECVLHSGKVQNVAGSACLVCTCITCWKDGDPLTDQVIEVLRLASTAEKGSTHPIAEAIIRYAHRLEIAPAEATEHLSISGMGVIARINGQEIKVGQRRFFEDYGEELPTGFREHVDKMQARGLTSVLIRYGEKWCAVGVQDQIRPGAKEFISALRNLGISRVVMLTGDNRKTADAVATELGINDVYSELLPQDKTEMISRWTREGWTVMMVGDGINDAPSLAKASIGVAMGGLGSDIALNAADAVLMQDKIERILELLRLGKKANNIIKTNLLFASGVIVALTFSSLFLALPLPLAVMGHEGSTVIVILNGLRLLRRLGGIS